MAETIEQIEDRIKEVLSDKFGLDPNELKKESDFDKDLGLDSLDRVELLMEAEKIWNIALPDDECEKAYTIGAFVELIEKKVNK